MSPNKTTGSTLASYPIAAQLSNLLLEYFSECAKHNVFSLLTASHRISGPRDNSQPSQIMGFCSSQQQLWDSSKGKYWAIAHIHPLHHYLFQQCGLTYKAYSGKCITYIMHKSSDAFIRYFSCSRLQTCLWAIYVYWLISVGWFLNAGNR